MRDWECREREPSGARPAHRSNRRLGLRATASAIASAGSSTISSCVTKGRFLPVATCNQPAAWASAAVWCDFADDAKASGGVKPRIALRSNGATPMSGADWFPGARLNHAEHALRHERDDAVVIVHSMERSPTRTLSWRDRGNHVRKMAERLRALDVTPGDRLLQRPATGLSRQFRSKRSLGSSGRMRQRVVRARIDQSDPAALRVSVEK